MLGFGGESSFYRGSAPIFNIYWHTEFFPNCIFPEKSEG